MTPAQRLKGQLVQKKWLCMFFLAVGMGLLCTIITWPGIFYSDSYGRWQMARDLTKLNFATQDDWLSVPPQLFMAAVYWLFGGSYAAYTFLQATAYFFAAFFAIYSFVPRGRGIAIALFAACPVFYGFSVYLEMSVGCLTALLWLLWLVLCFEHKDIKSWKFYKTVLYFLLCCFLYFVLLGFRQNAITVLPVLFFAVFLLCKKFKSPRALAVHTLAVLLCVLSISAIPKVLNFAYQSKGASGSVGFLWETVSMLQQLQEKPEYANYLDEFGQEGTTQKAVLANNYNSIYGYHDYIPNTVVSQGDNAAKITKKYFNLIVAEPKVFIATKARFMAYTLGLSQPLMVGEYEYNRNQRMDEFGYKDTVWRQGFYKSYQAFLGYFSVLRRPFVVFLAALAVFLPAKKRMLPLQRQRILAIYLAAAFYYAAFLLSTQSQEFRYFFVPFALLFIVAAASAKPALETLQELICKSAKAFKKGEKP